MNAAESFFDEMKRFVGFGQSDSDRLRALLPVVAPRVPAITDLFYANLLRHDGARQVFVDEQQVARLKKSLAEWLMLLFRGPHDEEYFLRRWEIGRTHVRIKLPERYLFGAMNVIRRSLLDIVDETSPAAAARASARHALERILDIELAIITESYRIDYIEKIKRQDRLASIGQIAASVNHELRNPLSVIGSSIYAMRGFIERGGEHPDEMRRHLDKIDRNLQRARKIADDLLEFARGRVPEKQLVDARELLEEALRLAALPSAVEREIFVEAGMAPIPVDRDQLGRVLLNLIQNATDAMSGSGKLTLSARAGPNRVLIEVADSGAGIAPEKLEVIFEPLYTTKPNGTGLGLPICRNIVAAHDGHISVSSDVGKGTTFTISLPLTATPKSEATR